MLKDFRRASGGRNNPSYSVTRNLSKLQKTQLEPDKSDFESLSYAKNLIHKGANADVRRGYYTLATVTDLLGIDIHETETENYLYAFAKDGSNTKVIHVDRSDGTTTDIVTGIAGQGQPDSTSISNWFYFVNGGNITKLKHDGTNSTLSISGETVKLITNDGSRLWFVCETSDGEILRFSEKYVTGDIANLTSTSSTLLNRAGIAESNISKFTSLERSGDTIIATGDNLTEVFRIPDFGGVTEFTADVPVRVASFPNIGTSGRKGITTIGTYGYIKPKNDGTLVRIGTARSQYGYSQKVYSDNLLQMEGLKFDNAALGYFAEKNLLLISCRDSENNDRVVCFNIVDETFSLFDNIFSTEWASDSENTYFWDNDKIYDAFQEGTWTDAGLPIEYEATTQMTDFGNQYNYKKLQDYYSNIGYNEDTTIDFEFMADRGVKGLWNPDVTKQVTLEFNQEVLGDYPQPYGIGVYGGAGTSFDESSAEYLTTRDKVQLNGVRFEMSIKGAVSTPLSIRGLGITAVPTQRQSKTVNYK